MTTDEYKRIFSSHGSVYWNGGWFCDYCYKWMHWEEEAYIVNHEKLCPNCYEKHIRKEIDITKGRNYPSHGEHK